MKVLGKEMSHPVVEWGVSSSLGVFLCRDEKHARAMMRSTSPIVGPMEGREIVSRVVLTSRWDTVKEES